MIVSFILFIYYRSKIQDIKELQKQRNKQNGVNATALALGKKLSKEQALSSVIFSNLCFDVSVINLFI